MTKDELAEIRALLVAREALAAERSRGLVDRLHQMFRPVRKAEAEPEPEPMEEAAAAFPPPPIEASHYALFEPADEPLIEPKRPHFGRREDDPASEQQDMFDEPLELITPLTPATIVPPVHRIPVAYVAPADDGGAPYHPDDLKDDPDWPEQALFEATIADWEETIPAAPANDVVGEATGARALLLRLEAALRIERTALDTKRSLKAA